jgi:capsular polysaccharide biosynthesis protein
MACARWETAYITEWLLYHQAIGFDHVYLYCNDDDPTDLYMQVLPFSRGEAPFVTFHHFPYQGQQFYMMMHALRQHKDASRWVAFLDVDEFLVLPGVDNIQDYLRRCPAQWDAIHFNWFFFGNNDHQERPPGSVLINYTRREDRLHPSTKTITRSARIDLSKIRQKVYVWHGWDGVFGPDFRAVNVLGDPIDLVRGSDEGHSYVRSAEVQLRIRNVGFVNHYAFKSAGDFHHRIERGMLGDFYGQAGWQRVIDQGQANATLQGMNAVEDTYLADYWRRYLRAAQDTRLVPTAQLPNVALGKPADQSSVSEWSRGKTTQEDAAGLVSGTITGDAQCHTALEPHPWWSVDLGTPHLIYEVRVFNRVSEPSLRERLGAFRVELAGTDDVWTPIYSNAGDRLIGGADGDTLIVKLPEPMVASRLRVMALGYTYLHLDQVQIHGVPAIDTAHPLGGWTVVAQPRAVEETVAQRDLSVSQPQAGREVARIALAELLALAQQEAVIRDDFLYVALLAGGGSYRRSAPLCHDTEDALRPTQIACAEYIERLEQTCPPIFHVGLRDAIVLGQGSVVTAGGALLIESCWEFFSHTGGCPPGLTKLANGHQRLEQRPARHIERPSLLVKGPFWRDYGRWLLDGAGLLARLPAMDLPADCQIIVGAHEDPKLRAIMRETLDRFAPGRPVIEQPDHEAWTVAALHYVTPLQYPPLSKHPAAIAELAARLQHATPAAGRRKLYVLRDSTAEWQLVNEAEVIALCQRFDFEVVQPDRLSLRDQAALFKSAACVVAVQGAALTNVVFCPAGARLFVLSPANVSDPFYWDLASVRGMGYGEMFGPLVNAEPAGNGRSSRHRFSINVERLARHLTIFCREAVAA